jgi:flavorubredoxin
MQPEKIFASNMGEKTLREHLAIKQDLTIVKDGESLSLGSKTLTFYETRMLHWPDSMFSYLEEDKILFSQDAFGMHLATAERFDDELRFVVLKREAAKYFANILLPYTPMVVKLLKKLEDNGVSPSMILPDHGPVWRSGVAEVLDLYAEWAQQKASDKAVVVYDTMWKSTEKMASAIVDGLLAGGARAELFPMSASHRADVATEILNAGAFIVGSPTLNNNMYPTIADILVYIKGLRRTGLIGAAFGSYGWGGEAVKQIEEALTAMKVEIIADGIKAKYVPDTDDLQKCFDMGLQIAEELKKKL